MEVPRAWLRFSDRDVLVGWAVTGGVAVLALLLVAPFLSADPRPGVTYSAAPFTDEGFSVMGARNLVVLGRWITDGWQLVVAQLPFNVPVAWIFATFEVGIVEARVVSLVCVVATTVLVATETRSRFGVGAAALATVALIAMPLELVYARLALLEPMETLWLIATAAAALRAWAAPADRPALRTTLLAGILAVLAVATKASAAASLFGLLIGATFASSDRRRSAIVAGGIAGVLVVALVAWLGSLSVAGIDVATALAPWPATRLSVDPGFLWGQVTEYLTGGEDRVAVLAGPLLLGAIAGCAVACQRWHRWERGRRRFVGAMIGWAALGFTVLLIAGYRPNRYVVPLLPPLAILTAVALEALVAGLGRWRVAGVIAIVAALVAGTAAQSAALHRTHALVRIQDELRSLLPAGAAVEGLEAPTLAMRAPVTTIVVQESVNDGDTYERYGVRWLLLRAGERPRWTPEHLAAWVGREQVRCWEWPDEICLYRVP